MPKDLKSYVLWLQTDLMVRVKTYAAANSVTIRTVITKAILKYLDGIVEVPK